MTHFTSGKVSHDPEPYEARLNRGMGAAYRFERPPVTEGWAVTYDPRPEFDNHNPILEAMRQELDVYRWMGDAVADWLNSIERGDHDSTLSADKIDHARRVLTKLAALS